MIQIETGVPIPKQDIRTVYPFKDLEPGQSFFIPNGNPNSMRVRACLHGKALGRKFKTSKVQGGMRVWRISMKDRFGRTIYMGWAEHELLWIEAALTLSRDERTAAFLDIGEITGRTIQAIRFQAQRIRKREERHAAIIVKAKPATFKPMPLPPSQLRQPSMAQLMGCR